MKKLYITLVLLTLSTIIHAQQKITAAHVGDKIEIRINGNLFTSYILSEHEKYPFFFPTTR